MNNVYGTTNTNYYDVLERPSENYKETNLNLSDRYVEIEIPDRILDNKKLHLYPNSYVYKIFEKIKDRELNDFQITKYLERKFRNCKLNISEDTTFYYSDKQIEKRVFTIRDGKILNKHNKELKDKDYIFVIDHMGRFIIDKKRKKSFGRIQHSSLSRGDSVKAAGMIRVTTNGASREFHFCNISGHYKPTPESLNILEKMFKNTGFKKRHDETDYDEEMQANLRIVQYSFPLPE